ncbi:MAG: beta-lactamase family protein [Trueperaceae bacterium]|nr:MAG: beta-lactamase family protein [Trueperaceae bacterium]
MHTVPPKQVGLSSERLSHIDRAMEEVVSRRDIPGLVTVVARRGKIAHIGRYGVAERERERPMNTDTIFRIYSMTKPVTSVLALMLLEEGRFALQEPVAMYLPGFAELEVATGHGPKGFTLEPAKRPVTIRDLFLHTSGLGYGIFDGDPLEHAYRTRLHAEETVVSALSLEKLCELLPSLPLAFQPGESWRYSLSTDVLGRVAEVVTGTPLDTLMRERIFAPLGMVDTGFFVPPEKLSRFSAMYRFDERGELALLDPSEGGPFTEPAHPPGGGTGLVSTAMDYLRFARTLLAGGELDGVRLLGERTHRYAIQNHIPHRLLPLHMGPDPMPGLGFGLGFAVHLGPHHGGSIVSPGSYSWGGIAGTAFWIDPAEDLIGLFLPQVMRLQYHKMLVQKYQNLVYQAISD